MHTYATKAMAPYPGVHPAVHRQVTNLMMPACLPPLQHGDDAGLLGALSIVAHDRRSPLANLALLLDAIEIHSEKQLYDRVRSLTKKAHQLIAAFSSMLNGFLDRARASGDPLSFDPAPIDMASVVDTAVALNRPAADRRQVTIECTSDAGCLVGDARLFASAIANLVGNPVRHSPENSTVECSARRSGNEFSIAVIDKGCGLTELELQRLFRPFGSLSSHHKNGTASCGLGPWIVRLIAERHGGRVEASPPSASEDARFTIRLPLLST